MSSLALNLLPSTLPEYLPARMVNEFVYCPRLFYYEFVEGVFVESVDTLRGAAIHQRVDSGNGALPAAKTKKKTEKTTTEEPVKVVDALITDATTVPVKVVETVTDTTTVPVKAV